MNTNFTYYYNAAWQYEDFHSPTVNPWNAKEQNPLDIKKERDIPMYEDIIYDLKRDGSYCGQCKQEPCSCDPTNLGQNLNRPTREEIAAQMDLEEERQLEERREAAKADAETREYLEVESRGISGERDLPRSPQPRPDRPSRRQ